MGNGREKAILQKDYFGKTATLGGDEKVSDENPETELLNVVSKVKDSLGETV